MQSLATVGFVGLGLVVHPFHHSKTRFQNHLQIRLLVHRLRNRFLMGGSLRGKYQILRGNSA
jgi:hypothetical protein